jgi:hypothetical protein
MGSKQRRKISRPCCIYGMCSDTGHGWWHSCDLVSQSNASVAVGIKLIQRRVYTANDAPRYSTGHIVNLSGQIGVFFLACCGIAYCKWDNKQRDQGKRSNGSLPNGVDGFRLMY